MSGEGKINLWNVKVLDKKRVLIFTFEVVGASKQEMENNLYYQQRTIRNSGRDPNLDKCNPENFTFEAELIKPLD